MTDSGQRAGTRGPVTFVGMEGAQFLGSFLFLLMKPFKRTMKRKQKNRSEKWILVNNLAD